MEEGGSVKMAWQHFRQQTDTGKYLRICVYDIKLTCFLEKYHDWLDMVGMTVSMR